MLFAGQDSQRPVPACALRTLKTPETSTIPSGGKTQQHQQRLVKTNSRVCVRHSRLPNTENGINNKRTPLRRSQTVVSFFPLFHNTNNNNNNRSRMYEKQEKHDERTNELSFNKQ